jgi:hypothetical protein
MKFIISLSLISFSFLASANTSDQALTFDSATSVESSLYPGGPGKRKNGKKMNKKRKRKCAKWSRKSYAG